MFTKEEHIENLDRLGINDYEELIGSVVYYVKPSYGVHKILLWDDETMEYLLKLDKYEFWSNPFKLKRC